MCFGRIIHVGMSKYTIRGHYVGMPTICPCLIYVVMPKCIIRRPVFQFHLNPTQLHGQSHLKYTYIIVISYIVYVYYTWVRYVGL